MYVSFPSFLSILPSFLPSFRPSPQLLSRSGDTIDPHSHAQGGGGGGGGRFLRTRGWLIIKWLAFADMMASLGKWRKREREREMFCFIHPLIHLALPWPGILIRSASWLGDDTFGSGPDDSTLGKSFCIVSSVSVFLICFIRFFLLLFFLILFFFFFYLVFILLFFCSSCCCWCSFPPPPPPLITPPSLLLPLIYLIEEKK